MSTDQPELEKEERTITEGILYYLGIVFHYKVMIIVTTIVVFSIAIIFSILTLILPADLNPLPNTYGSNVVIRFQSDNSTLSMDSLMASIGIQGSRGFSTDISLVVQYILNSGTFIDQLVDEFDLINRLEIREKQKTYSRQFVRNNSDYRYNPNSGLMVISFTYIDPVFTKNFVNRKVELLQEWFLKEGVSIRTRQMELLETRMKETQQTINDIELKIKDFQSKYGVLSVGELSDQLEAIRSDLQGQLVQVDMEIRQYSQYSRIEDPALSRFKAQRENILSVMAQLDNGYTINGKKLPNREELSELSLSVSRLTLDLSIQNGIYQTLAQRYEVLRLAAIEENVFSVLEWGEIAEEKLGPHRSQLCIVAMLLGFFGSVALAFIIHYAKNIIMDPRKTKLLKYRQGQ